MPCLFKRVCFQATDENALPAEHFRYLMQLQWSALRACLLIGISLLLFQTSSAEPYRHSATGIMFPDIVAGLERQPNVTDYEASTPGLGVSVAYDAPGIIATVYLYTMGMHDIPVDVDAPAIKTVFRSAADEIEALNEYGYYSGLITLFERTEPMSNAATGRQVLHGHYRFLMVQPQIESLSHLYLTSYRNHFFKIRYTYAVAVADYAESTLNAFLKEFDQILCDKSEWQLSE